MIQCFPRWLKNNYTSLRIQLQCSFFLPLGFSLIEQYLFYHSGEEYKALLCILGSSGVQIFAFMILEGSLGFLESVHEREWPVNGGRPYSWVPVKSIQEKKWANMKFTNQKKWNAKFADVHCPCYVSLAKTCSMRGGRFPNEISPKT